MNKLDSFTFRRVVRAARLASEARLVRIRLSRQRGWKMPPNTIKVCRPGLWGNPFKVSDNRPNAQAVVELYEAWLGSADWEQWLWFNHQKHWLRTQKAQDRFQALLAELRGHNLACWCGLNSPCHADVLLRLANNSQPSTIN